MYYAYVLISKNVDRTYSGITVNVEKRLKEHNEGNVISSKHFKPYEILKLESFKTKRQAREKELFYKSRTGRRRLKGIIEAHKLKKKEI